MFRCTEKFVAGSMFPLANLNAFRHFDDSVDFSATTEVKEAWMVFLNDFCPLVSYEWKEYLKNVVNKDSATFFGNLTVSDEAFAEWTIVCKYDESFAEAEKIKTMGMDNWSLQRKKGNVVRMTVEKRWMTMREYTETLLHIGKIEWQIQFGNSCSLKRF
jgi:hypothetical protein